VNGPAPDAGETLAMPLQVVVLSVNPVAFVAWVTETAAVGAPEPAAVNAKEFADKTTAGPTGLEVAVGDGIGVADDPGEGDADGPTGLGPGPAEPPPPPQATRAKRPAPPTARKSFAVSSRRDLMERCAGYGIGAYDVASTPSRAWDF